MNTHSRELYQEVIIDHGRHPRHCHALPQATASLEGFNPLCGDKIKVYVEISQNHLQALSFEGSGCAICIASASLMAERLQGKSLEEAKQMFDYFHRLITQQPISPTEIEALGKLKVLAGVQEYPMRVKCATLAWHTLLGALNQKQTPVCTE